MKSNLKTGNKNNQEEKKIGGQTNEIYSITLQFPKNKKLIFFWKEKKKKKKFLRQGLEYANYPRDMVYLDRVTNNLGIFFLVWDSFRFNWIKQVDIWQFFYIRFKK